MNLRTLIICIIAGVAILMPGCCKPILYKPSRDPSSIIFALKLPQEIKTLMGIPRDTTRVQKTDEDRKYLPPHAVKESFELVRKTKGDYPYGVKYTFSLFFDEESANKFFYGWYSFYQKTGRMFCENKSDNRNYFITYVEHPRSDAGGFCLPMSYYSQSAVFRLGNLVVKIDVTAKKRTSDLLTEYIEYLAEILEKEFHRQQETESVKG